MICDLKYDWFWSWFIIGLIFVMIGWEWTRTYNLRTRDIFAPNTKQHLIYYSKNLWRTGLYFGDFSPYLSSILFSFYWRMPTVFISLLFIICSTQKGLKFVKKKKNVWSDFLRNNIITIKIVNFSINLVDFLLRKSTEFLFASTHNCLLIAWATALVG